MYWYCDISVVGLAWQGWSALPMLSWAWCPNPSTLNPRPWTLNPAPSTLNPNNGTSIFKNTWFYCFAPSAILVQLLVGAGQWQVVPGQGDGKAATLKHWHTHRWRHMSETNSYWFSLILIDSGLMGLIDSDWFWWLILIGFDWLWLILIDYDWFWLILDWFLIDSWLILDWLWLILVLANAPTLAN